MSQDLTFLYSVRSPNQSTRLIWWLPTVLCVASTFKALATYGSSPMHYTCGWSHLHDLLHVCCGAPKAPYKSGCFGQFSQSVFGSRVDYTAKSLAVTFPWLCCMCRPHQTTCYFSCLSSFIFVMHIFSTVCIGAMQYHCTA